MITCFQAGDLPVIDRPPDTTESAGSHTLTEVVTAAIYGAPLKPGGDIGSLREACEPLRLEGRALWKDPNGPGWLRQHLELIAQGKAWPIERDTQDDCERDTLNRFAAAQRWLTEHRKLGFADGLPPELAEKVIRLAGMTDAEAIAHALAEADRIERAESAINAKAADFYKLLSDAIANQRITLKAIATDPRTKAWLPRAPGEPPHQLIPADYFELPMVHDLWDNQLEANRFSTEAKLLDSIFNRIERENHGLLIKWSDVKIPPEHVGWLLSTFRDKWKATGDRPLGQPQPAKPADRVPAPEQKMSSSFKKIRAAIQAEEQANGKPLPALRPVERNMRLANRMRAQGMNKHEIPNERTFREYFNNGPGKSEKNG